MSKYATVDSSGYLVGIYLQDPGNAIEISDELFAVLTTGWRYQNGEWSAPPEPTDAEKAAEAYRNLSNLIRANGESAAQKIKVPYLETEAQTWWCQYDEAVAWTANNSFVPVMLNAMVDSSSDGWKLSQLAANIITNASAWKSASGNILGQMKTKISELNSLKAQFDAGKKTLADLENFDCTIITPSVDLEDKFS